LDKKRWEIEPFSKIQKESIEVVDVIVTHAKVLEGPGWNDINFTDTLPKLSSWFGLDLTNPVALLCMSPFIQSARLA
jgi:hypothetical protein